MLGLDLGVVIVVEEMEIACVVSDVEIRGSTKIWWIHVGVLIIHGILSAVHENAQLVQVGGSLLEMAMVLDMHWFSKA